MARNHSGVIIVGGGPAGLAAAISLGRNDIPVTVLDRQTLPADKVCGEGIMPPGLDFLRDIGALSRIPNSDTAPFTGIRYVTQSGRSAEAEFDAGPGRGIRRIALSQALREVADELPCVQIREGVRVTAIARVSDGTEVHCDGGTCLTSPVVIGADGLRSKIRRWANLEGRSAGRKRFGIRQHYRIAPWSRFVEVHSGIGMEAYVTPCGSECVGVAILWEPDRIESDRALFESMIEEFPALRERLSGAEAIGQPRASGPFEQTTRRRTADGIALVGDASGYLDPCTGEGLTLAFRHSLALEHAVVPAFREGRVGGASLPAYERAWRKIMRPYFFCTRAMLFGHDHPALFEKAVKLFGNHPGILRHFLSYNMGLKPLLPGLPRITRRARPLRQTHRNQPDI